MWIFQTHLPPHFPEQCMFHDSDQYYPQMTIRSAVCQASALNSISSLFPQLYILTPAQHHGFLKKNREIESQYYAVPITDFGIPDALLKTFRNLKLMNM